MGVGLFIKIKRIFTGYEDTGFSLTNTLKKSDSVPGASSQTARLEDIVAVKQGGELDGSYPSSRLPGISPADRIMGSSPGDLLSSALLTDRLKGWNNAVFDRKLSQCIIEMKWEHPDIESLFLGNHQITSEPSIGLIEFSSIPMGMKTCDQMLKSAPVKLLEATTICPGKFVVVVYGDAVTVDYAMIKGRSVGEEWIADSLNIPNIDKQVIAALSGHPVLAEYDSLGVIETHSVASLIVAADAMTKLATVRILRIRLARELGGKAYIILGGTLGEVEACLQVATEEILGSGRFIQATTIPVPDEAMLQKMGLPLPNFDFSQNVFNTRYQEVGLKYGTNS